MTANFPILTTQYVPANLTDAYNTLVNAINAVNQSVEPNTEITAESYGASSSASAATNASAIQNALTNTGTVSLKTPGIYYINATLVIYSNTRFIIGPGVVIRQQSPAGQAKQILVNYAYTTYSAWNSGSAKSGPLTISAGNMTSSGKTVTVQFDQDHGLAVNDWVSIWNIGTAGYAGINQVVSVVNSTTITYTAESTPAASPAVVTAHAGYTMAGSKCDVNIQIVGGGILDFDQANNPSAPSSSPRTCCTSFFNCYNLYIDDVEARNAIKYNWYFSGLRSGRIRDVRANGPSDGVHFCANIFDTLLSGASGLTLDNFVAFGTADFATYQGCMGPVNGLTIENIGLEENKGIRCFGENENTIENVVIRNVYGTTSGTQPAIQLYDDSGVQGGGTVYKNMLVENVAVDVGTASLISAQGATGSTLTVRNCKPVNSTAFAVCAANNGSGTSRHAKILMEGCALTAAANNIAMLNVTNATATVDDAEIIGCTITSSSVSFGRMIDNTTGVLTAASIIGCTMNSGNALYVSGSAATVPSSIRLIGNYLNGCIYGVSYAKASAMKILASNNTITTSGGNNGFYRDASSGGSLSIYSSGNAYVSGNVFARTGTQKFAVYGYDISFDPLSTAAFGGTAGNIVVDTVAGSYLNSTRAGAVNQGPAIYTSSLGSWVAIGTGAAAVNTVIT